MMLCMKPSTEMGIIKGVEIDGIKNLQFAVKSKGDNMEKNYQFQQRKEYIGLSAASSRTIKPRFERNSDFLLGLLCSF